MNKVIMQPKLARTTRAALLVMLLAGGANCNKITGADTIDFTDESSSSAGDGGAGNSGSGGGTGNSDIAVAQACHAGDGAVVGVQVWADTWINGFVLMCADFEPNGHTSLSAYEAGPVAGHKAGTETTQYCTPPNDVVHFKYTHDAEHTYQIELGCSSPEVWKSAMPTIEEWVPAVGAANAGPQSNEKPCSSGSLAGTLNYLTVVVRQDDQSIRNFFGNHTCLLMP